MPAHLDGRDIGMYDFETEFLPQASAEGVGYLFASPRRTEKNVSYPHGLSLFIGGILFKKGLLGRTRTSLCIYGFIATMVIYGGLMNLYSALTSHSAFNLNMLITFYVQGFPMDIVHAVSTVIFLFFGAEPMLEKLDRIKVKYGLIE